MNDSLYRISFFFLGIEQQEYDTGYYHIRKDTLFLCSKKKTSFEQLLDFDVKLDYLDSIEEYDNLVFSRDYLVKKYHRYRKYSFFQKNNLSVFQTQALQVKRKILFITTRGIL